MAKQAKSVLATLTWIKNFYSYIVLVEKIKKLGHRPKGYVAPPNQSKLTFVQLSPKRKANVLMEVVYEVDPVCETTAVKPL